MKTNKFPKKIYVWLDQDSKNTYMMAQESIKGIDDGEKVGIYELKETKTVTVIRELK